MAAICPTTNQTSNASASAGAIPISRLRRVMLKSELASPVKTGIAIVKTIPTARQMLDFRAAGNNNRIDAPTIEGENITPMLATISKDMMTMDIPQATPR